MAARKPFWSAKPQPSVVRDLAVKLGPDCGSVPGCTGLGIAYRLQDEGFIHAPYLPVDTDRNIERNYAYVANHIEWDTFDAMLRKAGLVSIERHGCDYWLVPFDVPKGAKEALPVFADAIDRLQKMGGVSPLGELEKLALEADDALCKVYNEIELRIQTQEAE